MLYAGSNHKITKEHIDDVLSDFDKGDIILLQNEISNLEYVIEKASEKGMFIIFNCSPINDNIFSIDYSRINCVILNEVEMSAITDKESFDEGIDDILARYPDMKIMLTLGKRGCLYADKNTRVAHPIFETTVVDTTAAGDTFTGYFISEMAKGKDIADVLKVASCASAIAVSRHGASTSIPKYEEVMAALNTMKTK